MEATPSKEKKKKKAEDDPVEKAGSAQKKQKVEFATKFGIKEITNAEFLRLVKGPDAKDVENALKKHLEVNNKNFLSKTKLAKSLKEQVKAISDHGMEERNALLAIDSNLKNNANLKKMLDQLEPSQLKEIQTNFNVQCSKFDETRPICVISAIVPKVLDSDSAFECFQQVEKMLEINQEIKEFLDPLQMPQLKSLTLYHTRTDAKRMNQQQLQSLLFKHFINNNINPEVVRNSLELSTQQTGETKILNKGLINSNSYISIYFK